MHSDALLHACDRFGLRPSDLRHLGDGHFGGAWQTPRQTVLKVTRDPREIALVELGSRHRLEGLPVVWQGPIVCDDKTFAYEREALSDLPFFASSLHVLSELAKPTEQRSWGQRLSEYDERIQSPALYRKFPLIVTALRELRPTGHAVWDLKRNNLGLRGKNIVIRDGRCIRFDPKVMP